MSTRADNAGAVGGEASGFRVRTLMMDLMQSLVAVEEAVVAVILGVALVVHNNVDVITELGAGVAAVVIVV